MSTITDGVVVELKIFAALVLIILLGACSPVSNADKAKTSSNAEDISAEKETLTDENTKDEVGLVEATEGTILIEWGSDAMDRGNHDYETIAHSELVVKSGYAKAVRGDVVYYKTPAELIEQNPMIPEYYISRVVGLPGETIGISNGQVFIDGKKLDAFYSKATMTGMEEKEYFDAVDPSRTENEENTREYFHTSMVPVEVPAGSVFVLVDQWWRGTDSRDFGALPLHRIEGEVLGYVKK